MARQIGKPEALRARSFRDNSKEAAPEAPTLSTLWLCMLQNDTEEIETTLMPKSRVDLLTVLDLEQIEVNLFRGNSPHAGTQRVFGGQLIGQAMVAACRTVERRLPHSLHCYFIKAGDPKVPIVYKVERLRDGNCYSMRHVIAIQHGHAMFSITMSFHADEDGALHHQDKMPKVPPPERSITKELAAQPTFLESSEFMRRYYAIEVRSVEIGGHCSPNVDDGRNYIWIKTTAKLPEDPALHMCALAYASDYPLLDAVMARHRDTACDKRVMFASLDHAMWFHRPFHADDWLLYSQESPSAQDGRGLTRGLFFQPDGTLVASVAQEGSVRERH